MTNDIPTEILVLTGQTKYDDDDLELRGDVNISEKVNLNKIDLNVLHKEVNVLINQVYLVMDETPEQTGKFHLAEFEVSVGVVVEAKGGVKLALLATAEAGAGMNAGFKLTFKRK